LNIQGKGDEVSTSIDEIEGKFDVITLFDVIEHLDEETLISFVKGINKLLKKEGSVLHKLSR
jgi:2-polyprenyl-3-methyl-5-hydroxy-6-metoxy-1,4-benzoquinol methylase